MIKIILKLSLFVCVLFSFSCLNGKTSNGKTSYGDSNSSVLDLDSKREQAQKAEESAKKTARATNNTERRSGNASNNSSNSRRRTNLKYKNSLESNVDGRYSLSRIAKRDYRGEKECGDDSNCYRKCASITGGSSEQKRCGKLPVFIVEDIEEAVLTLRNIEDASSVRIEPLILAEMIDLGSNFFKDLIEDNMSEGDIKTFLAWIAINEDISRIFAEEDRSHKTIKTAVEKLAEINKVDEEDALKISLLEVDQTFLYLAADESNEYGFGIAYDILDDKCSNKECKQKVLCSREHRSRSRGASSRTSVCRTSISTNNRNRSFDRSSTCYIQGGLVWSYLNDLIKDDDDDGDVEDKDFEGTAIDVNYCNKFCGSENTRNEGKCDFSIF